MAQKEKDYNVHVTYNIQTKDINGEKVKGLEVETPLTVLIITKGFDKPDFDSFMNKLRTDFNYNKAEMVPLIVSNSKYDFVLITCEAIEDRPMGVTFLDHDGGRDGHELEIAKAGESFISEHEFNRECDHNIGLIYNGECYGSDVFLKELLTNDMKITFDKTIYGISEVQILHQKIYFTFHMIDEICIPYMGDS